MSQRLFITFAWCAIILLAFQLRLSDLGERPIHADEATGARILSRELAGEAYTFNPQHFHGPLLSLTSVPITQIRGESSWPELTEATLRLCPALAGLLLVLTPLLWQKQIGPISALAAAALLATSPLLVYYNRMYIHESLLTLFALLGCNAIYRFCEHPTKYTGIIAGLCIGLMFATKETFVISILSWFPAAALYCWLRHLRGGQSSLIVNSRHYIWPMALLIGTAAFTASYFYSDGFRSPQGIVDAVRTYFVYETTAGHEKSFSYYFELLLWPKQALSTWWSEWIIGSLALTACIFAFRKRSHLLAVPFLAVATAAHLFIYSCISYKTPWLMLVPWAHACLLAGAAFSFAPTLKKHTRIALTLVLLVGLAHQTQQSLLAIGRATNDSRNPYVYVPTSKDAAKIQSWLNQLAALPENQPFAPIAVIGQEYWPLPWYLRSFETVGYWPEPIEACKEFPAVFAMPAHEANCDTLLEDTHVKLPRGLRTNVPVTLYLRNDIWKNWTQTSEK